MVEEGGTVCTSSINSHNPIDMVRLLIEPTTFQILPMQKGQNEYIVRPYHPHHTTLKKEHMALVHAFQSGVVLYRLPRTNVKLPDIVFVANGGLALPRLPRPTVLLPNMKWPQRKAELPFLKDMYAALGITAVEYPGTQPFEGQAELKWFDGGRKAVCGYGYRSTRKTFDELATFFRQIYGSRSPELLVLPLASPDYYHLDVAMCEIPGPAGLVDRCMVHRRAFSPASHRRLAAFLGNNVTVIDTTDSFCLNAVVDGPNLITHVLTDPALKPLFQKVTGLRVVEVPTQEFEKSGGSVRCMTLDLPDVSRV